MWKPFKCGDDVILSMIHQIFFCLKLAFMDGTSARMPHLGHVKCMVACHSGFFFCHKLAFMDDASARMPHLGHVKCMVACHSCQIFEDLTFLAFSIAAVVLT